jgi:hypothetical protein
MDRASILILALSTPVVAAFATLMFYLGDRNVHLVYLPEGERVVGLDRGHVLTRHTGRPPETVRVRTDSGDLSTLYVER